ncbi:MAG: hypothetical protein KKF33_08930, partial [Alphaproteobacteria bacterium]|nr:hypothetical protein [Alphaproteobacteria bacterium]
PAKAGTILRWRQSREVDRWDHLAAGLQSQDRPRLKADVAPGVGKPRNTAQLWRPIVDGARPADLDGAEPDRPGTGPNGSG